jgi:hypothetical protein
MLTQIEKREGWVNRVRGLDPPVVELHLEPGEYIVSFELRESYLTSPERKTSDWYWTAYVVTPLPNTEH